MILFCRAARYTTPAPELWNFVTLPLRMAKLLPAAKGLNAADAETVMDVTGLIVSPGLIDMHCHVYPVFPYQMPDSLRTINAEEYMFRAGVTTAVDAGTTGWRNFGDFKENVIDATKVRVLAFIDMAAKDALSPVRAGCG